MVARQAERLPDQRLRLEIEAAAPMLHRGTWFSHRSAAALHGLPVVIRSTTRVEVVRTFGGHGGRSSRLHARTARLLPGEGVFLNGIPATSVERTVTDLVRVLPFPEAVMLVDAALRKGVPRETLLAGLPERGRGCRMAERAVTFGDPASESPGESESRARLALAGLPTPELQVEIYGADGVFIARPDFLWRSHKVIGEYDGEGKYTGQFGVAPVDVIHDEKEREAALEAAGYLVLRWGKRELRRPGEVERRVQRALAGRRLLPVGES